jgi:hypothetical protein
MSSFMMWLKISLTRYLYVTHPNESISWTLIFEQVAYDSAYVRAAVGHTHRMCPEKQGKARQPIHGLPSSIGALDYLAQVWRSISGIISLSHYDRSYLEAHHSEPRHE